jgi:hypothetical protein
LNFIIRPQSSSKNSARDYANKSTAHKGGGWISIVATLTFEHGRKQETFLSRTFRAASGES